MDTRHWMAVAALASMLAVAGCATDPKQRDSEQLALYRAHAGEPVGSFDYFGRISGWTPLGDSALAVWTRPSQAWLLELTGPCQDLEYAPAIGLTGNMNRVYARFDKVLVNSRGPVDMPCHIQQIRPLDVKALKAAQQELREARVQERAAEGNGG